jgi:hypothetical protein
MHMLSGSFIIYGLLGMIHVSCAPLEGVLVCLCKTLLGESFSMEAQDHLDLHRGFKPTGSMKQSHSLHTWEDERCLWTQLYNMR